MAWSIKVATRAVYDEQGGLSFQKKLESRRLCCVFQFGNIHLQRMKRVRSRYLCLLSFTYTTSCLNNNNNSLSIEFCENLSGNYTTKA